MSGVHYARISWDIKFETAQIISAQTISGQLKKTGTSAYEVSTEACPFLGVQSGGIFFSSRYTDGHNYGLSPKGGGGA